MTHPTTKIPITDKAAYAAGYRDGSRAALRDVLRDPRWLEELYDPCEDEDAGLIDEHVRRACNDRGARAMNRRERRQFEAELRALARSGVEVSELGRLKEGWTCNCSALRARRRDAASLQRHRAREWRHGGERRHRDPGETTALNRTAARTPARERPLFRFVHKSDSSTGVKDDVR